MLQLDVWEGYSGKPEDTLDMEIYQVSASPTGQSTLAPLITSCQHWH